MKEENGNLWASLVGVIAIAACIGGFFHFSEWWKYGGFTRSAKPFLEVTQGAPVEIKPPFAGKMAILRVDGEFETFAPTLTYMPDNESLPARLRAKTPQEVATFVFVKVKEDCVATYEEEKTGHKSFLYGYRVTYTVRIVDTERKVILGRRNFVGDDPPESFVLGDGAPPVDLAHKPTEALIAYLVGDGEPNDFPAMNPRTKNSGASEAPSFGPPSFPEPVKVEPKDTAPRDPEVVKPARG